MYFDDNAQSDHHSNIEVFYRHIYFETVDTVANCIVEHYNQKYCNMYANCEQVFLKGTLGELSHKMSTNCVSSTQSLTLITDTWRIQLSIYVARVLSLFQPR